MIDRFVAKFIKMPHIVLDEQFLRAIRFVALVEINVVLNGETELVGIYGISVPQHDRRRITCIRV